jgi:hypothetical protein
VIQVMKPLFSLLLVIWTATPTILMMNQAQAQTSRVDLTGVIQSKAGRPIPGASAFVYTAGPKLGIGFL